MKFLFPVLLEDTHSPRLVLGIFEVKKGTHYPGRFLVRANRMHLSTEAFFDTQTVFPSITLSAKSPGYKSSVISAWIKEASYITTEPLNKQSMIRECL
jgi:hypothetical protein